MSKKWFTSKHLLSLYKKGKLDKVLKRFKINSKKWIGSGHQASAFAFNDNEVLKICSKKIPYFKKRQGKTAKDLLKRVNTLQPFLVPINKILYENHHIFIYTQDQCQPFGEHIWQKPDSLATVFQLIIMMLQNNLSIIDMGLHNIGLYKGHAAIFDPHNLYPVISKEKWLIKSCEKLIPGLDHKQRRSLRRLIKDTSLTDIANNISMMSRQIFPLVDSLIQQNRDRDSLHNPLEIEDQALTNNQVLSTIESLIQQEDVPIGNMANNVSVIARIIMPIIQSLIQHESEGNLMEHIFSPPHDDADESLETSSTLSESPIENPSPALATQDSK